MHPDWHAFLQGQGAAIQDNTTQHFGDPATELETAHSGTVLCTLDHFARLGINGSDAPAYLQNLLSSDLREITPQHARISSLNSPKGRMLASFILWQTGENYFMHLPRSQCSLLLKRLSLYVLRSKVKITDASDAHVCLGIAGPDAAALLQDCLGSVPQQIWDVAQHEAATIICIANRQFVISADPQHAPTLWQQLATGGAHPAGAPCWDWLTIHAGLPVILPATQEQFVPQMANLELLGGVNFKKGCYPGQEIVARMQYLGKLKRRMYLAHLEAGNAPQAGDALYSADMEDQPSGMVVNAAAAPGGGYDLLAVVQTASREAQDIHLHSPQGAVLHFLPLPYSGL